MTKEINYSVTQFPSSRQSTFDVGYISVRKNHMKALIELDVTDARKLIHSYRKEKKENVSFLAWMIKCIGVAIAENKSVHSLRKGKNKLVVFDDVDISIAVEKEVQGEKVPLPVVIRKVNEKTLQHIHLEIKSAKEQAVKDENDYILGENRFKWLMKFYVSLPQFIRLAIWRIILKNPLIIKKMSGTVVVTSVGMMGNVKGWAIPSSFLPICIVLGSIVKKPGVIQNRIEIREYLHMSIAIDHDVIDGAPATRFVSQLAKLIENGYGLK
jgi:Pyruvate/2-oxoglutarate dehydrogenase complex, dihydrolipoamide acyltransferase (E2) component, and related enzymes